MILRNKCFISFDQLKTFSKKINMNRARQIIFVFIVLTTFQLAGQSSADTKQSAVEKQYEFLVNDIKSYRENMQKENESYRNFIQEERSEHQQFLERGYLISGSILGVLTFILTFLGISTLKGINESRKEFKTSAEAKLTTLQNEITAHSNRLIEAKDQLKQAEIEYNSYLSYYKNSNPVNGRYLLIVDKEKLKEMNEKEIPRFEAALGKLETLATQQIIDPNTYFNVYDVIIYRSNADASGEDSMLQELVDKLSSRNIPILVYATSQSERIQGKTEKKLQKNGLYHMANNPITLIDNTASAYRVSKLTHSTMNS